MVVSRRVPSPRSVRHLWRVPSVTLCIVERRACYVKQWLSTTSRARRTEARRAVGGSSNTVRCFTEYSFDSPLRSQDLGGRSVFLASRALEIELFYTFSREGLSETANVGSFLSLQRG